MGRPRLSDEENVVIKKKLINAAREILSESGLQGLTIRAIAGRMDMNSAMIYKYFHDLDELVIYACVDYLKNYLDELSKEQSRLAPEDSRAQYLLTWKLFCRYAFKEPQVFYLLFFGHHSSELANIVQEYYGLYPNQLEELPVRLQNMVLASDLRARNMTVLQPVFGGSRSREEIGLINDITVSSFRCLLSEMLDICRSIEPAEQIARMMTIVEYMIK